jgi:hypothetical protein
MDDAPIQNSISILGTLRERARAPVLHSGYPSGANGNPCDCEMKTQDGVIGQIRDLFTRVKSLFQALRNAAHDRFKKDHFDLIHQQNG